MGQIGRPQLRQPFPGVEGLQLRKREILGEPAGDRLSLDRLGRATRGELRVIGDVGGAADLIFVPGDQMPVFGRYDIGLDEVGALVQRQRIGSERVLRPLPRRAAMADNERTGDGLSSE